MKSKEQQIQDLVRDDYPLPLFQELIAEMVYETQNYSEEHIEDRFNIIIQNLLGDPSIEQEFDGYQNDNYFLGRLSIMANMPLPGEEKPMGTGRAAWEIAREIQIKGYKIGDGFPKDFPPNDKAAVTKIATRLKDKIDGKEKHYAKLHHIQSLEADYMLETNHEEIEIIERMISSWLKRYRSQLSFSSKNE